MTSTIAGSSRVHRTHKLLTTPDSLSSVHQAVTGKRNLTSLGYSKTSGASCNAGPTHRTRPTHRKRFHSEGANSFPENEVLAVKFWYLNDQGKVEGDKDVSELWKSTAMYGDNENDERRAGFEKLLFAAVDEAVRVHPEKPAEWGVPQPLTHDELPQVMPFKIEYLPRGIRDLVHDVAYRMSVPTDLPAIVGVVALAGVVNRRAHVYPRQHDKTSEGSP